MPRSIDFDGRLDHIFFVKMENICNNYLGPRGPLVLPLIGPVPSRPVRAKNLDHLYTGIYAL